MRVLARAAMNGESTDPTIWMAMFPTLFGPGVPEAVRTGAEAVLSVALDRTEDKVTTGTGGSTLVDRNRTALIVPGITFAMTGPWRNGALYRPAQVCAPLYGSGISINRVQHLSPQAYVEQEEERILTAGSGGLLGIHTLNRSGELGVVDCFLRSKRVGARAARARGLSHALALPLATARHPDVSLHRHA